MYGQEIPSVSKLVVHLLLIKETVKAFDDYIKNTIDNRNSNIHFLFLVAIRLPYHTSRVARCGSRLFLEF